MGGPLAYRPSFVTPTLGSLFIWPALIYLERALSALPLCVGFDRREELEATRLFDSNADPLSPTVKRKSPPFVFGSEWPRALIMSPPRRFNSGARAHDNYELAYISAGHGSRATAERAPSRRLLFRKDAGTSVFREGADVGFRALAAAASICATCQQLNGQRIEGARYTAVRFMNK